MNTSFKEKVAVVTGGGSGIGRDTALLFSRHEAAVAVLDTALENAQSTADAIREEGGDSIGVFCDVSQADSVRVAFHKVMSHYDRIDILFNNAGIIMPGFIEDISDDNWSRVVAVNLSGVFHCIKCAMPELKRRRGVIVNMASMNGLVGQMKNPAYSATKGGVIAMTRSVAIDAAPFGVRVNAVCPAGVLTPLLEDWFEKQPDPARMKEDTDLSHMLGRTATPEEIGRLVLYLASDDASFITGQAIPIEGGATLGYGMGPKAEWELGGFEKPSSGGQQA